MAVHSEAAQRVTDGVSLSPDVRCFQHVPRGRKDQRCFSGDLVQDRILRTELREIVSEPQRIAEYRQTALHAAEQLGPSGHVYQTC